MNSYTGLHAELYDQIYAEKPYVDEARFVHELAGCPGGRLLDVACGTGRHALAFSDLGYQVTGTDINEELLAVARHNGSGRFVVGDMRHLEVEGGPFDVVTCLFDSIGYAQDNEGVVASLRSLRRHVSSDGKVICEFLHAPGVLTGYSPARVRRMQLQDGRRLLRTSETRLDVEQMIMQVRHHLVVMAEDGRMQETTDEQSNRCFSAPEMRLLATSAGLRVERIVLAYRRAPIESDSFHLLLVAARGE